MIDDMEEIWVLYADDGAQALDTAEQALAEIASAGHVAMAEGVASLFRSVHTFKGNARVLGLRNAERRAHVTEDLIGLVRDQGAPWDDEMAQILVLAMDRLRAILEQTATLRSDIDDSFGADLLEAVSGKIDRLTGAVADVAVNEDTTPDASETPVEAKAPQGTAARPRSSYEDQAATLMAQIIGPLSMLGDLQAQPDMAAECAQILRDIANQAESLRFLRLADTALALAGTAASKPPLGDGRLYEELYAIEVSLPEGALPHPHPKAIYQQWCATNAMHLLQALDAEVRSLSQGLVPSIPLTGLAQTIRRLSLACQHHESWALADWASALLDAVMTWDGTTDKAGGSTLVQMVRAFAVTLGAALPHGLAEQSGLTFPSTAGSGGLFDDESLAALIALDLPPQFMCVLTPHEFMTAWHAVQEGAAHWSIGLGIAHMSSITAGLLSLVQDGAVRLVAAVPIRKGTSICLAILLETKLTPSEVIATFAPITSVASDLHLEPLTKNRAALSDASGNHSIGQAGVSVEMLEMLGEVSTGLTQTTMRLAGVIPSALSDLQGTASAKMMNDHSQSKLMAQVAGMTQGIDESIKALDGLAQQVSDLQQDAIASRLRPATKELAHMIEGLGKSIRNKAPGVSLSLQSDDMKLDGQTLELIGKLCGVYMPARVAQCTTERAVLSITLRQREDRAILMVTDHLPKPNGDEILAELRRLVSGAGGRVWTQAHADGRHGLVISLPTRALAMEAMIITSGGTHYGLPVDSLVMVQSAGREQILRRAAAGASRFLRLDNGEVLTIVTLENRKVDQGGIFVILQASGRRKALLVDTLLGHQVVRLRPLQGVTEKLDKLSGFAVLAGGEIAPVLSPLAICHDNDFSQMVFDEP